MIGFHQNFFTVIQNRAKQGQCDNMAVQEENQIKTVAVLDSLTQIRVQCAGPHFMKYLARIRHGIDGNLSNASSIDKISDDEDKFEIDVEYLRSLDPKEWKDQDHYHVLGLKKLR